MLTKGKVRAIAHAPLALMKFMFTWQLHNQMTNKKNILGPKSRCLKITENVSFNFASEASYIYIVDKSSLKMPKMANLAKMEKIKCDIFSDFQTMWKSAFWTLPLLFFRLIGLITLYTIEYHQVLNTIFIKSEITLWPLWCC